MYSVYLCLKVVFCDVWALQQQYVHHVPPCSHPSILFYSRLFRAHKVTVLPVLLLGTYYTLYQFFYGEGKLSDQFQYPVIIRPVTSLFETILKLYNYAESCKAVKGVWKISQCCHMARPQLGVSRLGQTGLVDWTGGLDYCI